MTKLEKRTRKAVSPVIATTLLILIVVILALIIFLLAKSFIKEAVQKQNMPAEQACQEINIDASWTDDKVDVVNRGNIKIYRLIIKGIKGGKSERKEIEGIDPGEARTLTLTDYEKIIVIPAILGKTSRGKSQYNCDEKYGIELENPA